MNLTSEDCRERPLLLGLVRFRGRQSDQEMSRKKHAWFDHVSTGTICS
jgi:hypothetical protein